MLFLAYEASLDVFWFFNSCGAALLWIGVACVNVMGRMWIICFYIVVRFFGYRVFPLDLLVFLGFYLKGLLTRWPVGGIGWGSILQMFGIWYHIV